MKNICFVKEDYEEAENHDYEIYKTEKKIKQIMKSPFKVFSPEEIAFELAALQIRVKKEMYSEVTSMFADPNYRPCEDCTHMHEYVNSKRYQNFNKYCAFHEDWGNDAGQAKTSEILECRKNNWKDYYARTRNDLEAMKTLIEYELNIPEPMKIGPMGFEGLR